MTFIQLKYFRAICKHNNITRAANELHISQPSLSSAIKDLEQEFGVSLFIRHSRGLELTPEGEYFLSETEKLLTLAEQVSTHMKRLGGANHPITLGLPAMSGSLVFPDLLGALNTRSPGTQIQVMESGSLSNRTKVIEHDIDAAIITRNDALAPSLDFVTLRHVDICLYVSSSHPLAKKKSIEIADLDNLPLAMLPEDTFLSTCMENYYHNHHLNLNILIRTNQLATIQKLVAANTAVSFLLDHVLDTQDDIVKLPVPELLPTQIDLIWKSDKHLSPSLKKLIAAAKSI